jgi:hypothetical protein
MVMYQVLCNWLIALTIEITTRYITLMAWVVVISGVAAPVVDDKD